MCSVFNIVFSFWFVVARESDPSKTAKGGASGNNTVGVGLSEEAHQCAELGGVDHQLGNPSPTGLTVGTPPTGLRRNEFADP